MSFSNLLSLDLDVCCVNMLEMWADRTCSDRTERTIVLIVVAVRECCERSHRSNKMLKRRIRVHPSALCIWMSLWRCFCCRYRWTDKCNHIIWIVSARSAATRQRDESIATAKYSDRECVRFNPLSRSSRYWRCADTQCFLLLVEPFFRTEM